MILPNAKFMMSNQDVPSSANQVVKTPSTVFNSRVNTGTSQAKRYYNGMKYGS